MIYTLTINPSLDYYINLTDKIKYGNKNRSSIETYEAGGKGVNVSIFLDQLGISSTTLGFLGGFTKSIYLDYINRYKNIEPSFTTIKENTRINVTNLSDNTSFNAKGPSIDEEEFNKLLYRLNNLYKDDYLIISGNIQDEVKDNFIKVINNIDFNDFKLFLDIDSDILNNINLNNCFLIKINETINDFNLIKDKANYYLNKNVKYVLYEDRDSDEVYLFNKNISYKFIEKDKNTNIHYTDSFIASLVYSFSKGATQLEAFIFSCAACKLLTFSGYNETIIDKINSKVSEISNQVQNV